MGKVTAGLTMSLDGFIAGPDDDVRRLFRWYASGDTDFPVQDGRLVFKVSRASAELLRETWGGIGALVTGRRDFDVSGAWGGQPPLPVPTFVVTHAPPAEWAGEGSPFTFVTDGVPAAVARAREAAGDKNVAVGGSTIVQQCLRAGLLDELHVDLAPVLLGAGVRLFDDLGGAPVDLEYGRVVATPDVAHLQFRVVR